MSTESYRIYEISYYDKIYIKKKKTEIKII